MLGVSISAITGNESAMEKAKQAKTANEKADELDTLKLAVVEAVSRGLTGTVTQENLQAALNGVSGFSMTSNGDGTFTVTGSKGAYTVTENGSVTRKNGLTLNTRSLSVTEGSTGTITATLSGNAVGKTITWKAEGGTEFNDGTTSTIGESVTVKAKAGTITVSVEGEDPQTCTVSVVSPPPAVGTNITYTTSLNGVELNNWKVFYNKTKNGTDYTYLILADYMQNSAVGTNMTGLSIEGCGSVRVKGDTDRTTFLNAIKNKSNWSSLLQGTLSKNGTTKTINETSNANAEAMGSPTLELWVDSWNETYPDDYLYTDYANPVSGQSFDGWYIDLAESPQTNNKISVNLSSKDGFSNPLYYPHKNAITDNNGCYGYWLASPSASSTDRVMIVYFSSDVNLNSYYNTSFAFRPVVCLPSSVLK